MRGFKCRVATHNESNGICTEKGKAVMHSAVYEKYVTYFLIVMRMNLSLVAYS